MTLERGLAESCNAYFLALARVVAGSPEGMQAITRISGRYGLPSPFESTGNAIAAPDLIGLTPTWRVSPSALVRAYAVLLTEPLTPVTTRLRNGMRMAAAARGTASHVSIHAGGVLAKTGTAPCVASADEACIASGDGGVIVAFPAEEPTQLLLVRERATTGAEAAATAGAMLSLLEKSNAAAH
jgi:cell division protein FtsI/penicillin-binding protein 2